MESSTGSRHRPRAGPVRRVPVFNFCQGGILRTVPDPVCIILSLAACGRHPPRSGSRHQITGPDSDPRRDAVTGPCAAALKSPARCQNLGNFTEFYGILRNFVGLKLNSTPTKIKLMASPAVITWLGPRRKSHTGPVVFRLRLRRAGGYPP